MALQMDGDAAIAADLRERLATDPYVLGAVIASRVEGGEAVLEGRVASEVALRQAETIARETPGVVAVRNLLELDPTDAPPARDSFLTSAVGSGAEGAGATGSDGLRDPRGGAGGPD